MARELTDGERALLEEVREHWECHERYAKSLRDHWDYLFSLYRSYDTLKKGLSQSEPPDRDTVLREAKREWGAELAIPIAFQTVETILPRAISNRPRMLILPKDEDAELNVENMKNLIDEQQRQIGYEMTLEETGKSGFIYGLGVQKLRWEKRFATRRQLEPSVDGTFWVEGDPRREKVFDDWIVEDLDLANFAWDPFGYDMRTCRWAIHRIWLTTGEVVERIERGVWNTKAAQGLTGEEVNGMSSMNKYDEAFRARMTAGGYQDFDSRGHQLHEVWEFHDRERVCTILDREIPVQVGMNPAWHGELPFHVFRPTTAGIKQLCGIGVVEPIEHLIREMNTLRSQRRDNAALKLMQVFAYQDGAIEKSNLKFAPGYAIPTLGDPRELLYPINVGDIPNSGYQEEANLTQDIDRTTGISDTLTGADASGAGAQTATGVQLVQAAANIRIQRQTRRMEVEMVIPECRQAVLLNQQRITSERPVRVPKPPAPGQAGPAWEYVRLGPGELAGLFEIDAEGGSTGPRNVPQRRQDAQFFLGMFRGDPMVDQTWVRTKALELLDISHPEARVTQEQTVPAAVLDEMVQMWAQSGQDPKQIEALIQAAIQGASEAGPSQLNGGGAPAANGSGQGQPSDNGSQAPEPVGGS